MEIPINPHETIGDKQWMFWNMWLDKKPVEFLLIDYFKAPTVKRGRGLYTVYYAIAQEPIDHMNVKAGDEIILFITYKAYVNAINVLCNEYRTPSMKKFAEGKNLYIKIEKVDRGRIKIHKQEVREPTEEQLLEADRQYKMIQLEHENRNKFRSEF